MSVEHCITFVLLHSFRKSAASYNDNTLTWQSYLLNVMVLSVLAIYGLGGLNEDGFPTEM